MYLPKQHKIGFKRSVTDNFMGIDRKGKGEIALDDTLNLCTGNAMQLESVLPVYELDRYGVGKSVKPVFFNNGGIGYIAAREDEPGIYSLVYKGQHLTDFSLAEDATSLNLMNFNGKTLVAKGTTAYEFAPDFTSPLDALHDIGYTVNIQPAKESAEYPRATLRLSLLYEDMTEVGSYSGGDAEAQFPTDAEEGDCFSKLLEPYRLLYKDTTDKGEDEWQAVTSFRLRLNFGDGYRRYKAGDYISLEDLTYWSWAVRKFTSLDRFIRIDEVDSEGRYITEAIPVFDDYTVILTAITYPTNDIVGYFEPIINNSGNDLYLLGGRASPCMPELDFICAGANRVWGCSNSMREIYASELGNARNWRVYDGLSGDSYAVTVGSPGDFTACCSYLGTPVFFKENEMIVISGSRPSSFTLNSYSVRGVRRDSPMGFCVVGDTLYYMSYDGVFAYNGASSTCVSGELGDEITQLHSAVFGGDGDMLYVSGIIGEEPIHYCYDTVRKIWHRRSSPVCGGYISYPDATLEVCLEEDESYICTLTDIPKDYELTGALFREKYWMWKTGDISYSSCESKYIRRIALDTECDGESDLYISYDGGIPEHIIHLAPHSRNSRRITLFPHRCNSFSISMEGKGSMKLYTMTVDSEEADENG